MFEFNSDPHDPILGFSKIVALNYQNIPIITSSLTVYQDIEMIALSYKPLNSNFTVVVYYKLSSEREWTGQIRGGIKYETELENSEPSNLIYFNSNFS